MKHLIKTLHHFFIPHQTNNFRAKLLHHDFLTVYLLFALTITIGIGHIQKTQGSILGFATDISVQKLFDLTNQKRAAADLPILKYNDKLGQAAQKKAEDMFGKNYWSHYGPSGETPWEFILGSGYQYEYAGENLAKNFLFSDGVVDAWMASPSHKENMLRKEYTDVGYAVVNGTLNGEETTLVVQMFGKPLYSDVAQAGDQPPNVPIQTYMPDNKPVVLAKDSAQPKFFSLYFDINLIFFTVLVLALILDFYFAAKLNFISFKGKNLIHMLFIMFIAIGAFIIVRGSIT